MSIVYGRHNNCYSLRKSAVMIKRLANADHYYSTEKPHNYMSSLKLTYHYFGGVLHKPNAWEREGDGVEVLGFAVQTVADNVTADDLVLAHLHHTLYGCLWLGLEDGRR